MPMCSHPPDRGRWRGKEVSIEIQQTVSYLLVLIEESTPFRTYHVLVELSANLTLGLLQVARDSGTRSSDIEINRTAWTSAFMRVRIWQQVTSCMRCGNVL